MNDRRQGAYNTHSPYASIAMIIIMIIIGNSCPQLAKYQRKRCIPSDGKCIQSKYMNLDVKWLHEMMNNVTIHFSTPCAQASTPSISKTVYYKSPCACVHMCLCAVFINIAHVHTGTQAHGHTGTQACTQAHRHPHYTVLLLDGVSLCAGCAFFNYDFWYNNKSNTFGSTR